MRTTARDADPTVYPETDDMGEHELQRFIIELLRPLVERWLRTRGKIAHVGADQFFYWVKGDPSRCRAPDLYVVDGVSQDIPEVAVWKVWEGHCPVFALEVCGLDWQKDYDHAPRDYAAMGTTELVIFDPGATSRSLRRKRWQVYRRLPDGRFGAPTRTHGDRVYSQVLGAWLCQVDDRGRPRVRLGDGWRGREIFRTEAEAAVQTAERERAEKEVERAEKEVERAEKERAVSALRDALEEIARLRRR